MDGDISSQDLLTPHGMQLPGSPQPSLADIHGMTGYYPAVTLNLPCTASNDQTCELLTQLPLWNELLLPAQLQLQDFSGGRSQLSLATWIPPDFLQPTPDAQHNAWACACWLIKSHHCIVALDLSLNNLGTWDGQLFEAMKANGTLKHLEVSYYTSGCSKKLCTVILSLKRLEELRILYGEGSSQLLLALSTLLRSTMSLRCLSINLFSVTGDASLFLDALCANPTLKELSINEGVLDSVDTEQRECFAKYIENNPALTTLHLIGGTPTSQRESSLNCVLRGLLKNKTIRNLRLGNFLMDLERASLITNLLEGNECLRFLNLTSSWVPRAVSEAEGKHRSLALALARSKGLGEITLSIKFFDPPHWRLFCEALASNRNRVTVIITGDIYSHNDLVQVCQAARDSGVDDRVSISTEMCIKNLETLKYKGLSRIFVSPPLPLDGEHMSLLHQLSSCSHITSVRLRIALQQASETVFTAIARYIETATTLKEFFLQAVMPKDSPDTDMACWTIVSTSLTRNTSIQEVGILALGSGKEVAELLADAIKFRKNTWKVDFNSNASDTRSAFVRRFSWGIADNYRLLRVNLRGWIDADAVPNWFAVEDTARRNCGLLMRAAQFVSGSVDYRMGAQALERVHSHAALHEELTRGASIESGQAGSMIRRALRGMQSMHDFMRLSGVVKERVVCLPSLDGRPQLDDLDEYSWGRLRRYLLIEHVRFRARQSP